MQAVKLAPELCTNKNGCCLVGYNVYSIPGYLLGSHSKRFTWVGNVNDDDELDQCRDASL